MELEYSKIIAALIEKSKHVEYHKDKSNIYLAFDNFAEDQPDSLISLEELISSVLSAGKNTLEK